jgi:hypothetical protein
MPRAHLRGAAAKTIPASITMQEELRTRRCALLPQAYLASSRRCSQRGYTSRHWQRHPSSVGGTKNRRSLTTHAPIDIRVLQISGQTHIISNSRQPEGCGHTCIQTQGGGQTYIPVQGVESINGITIHRDSQPRSH